MKKFLQTVSNVMAGQWLRFRRWLTWRRALAIVTLLVLALNAPWLMEAGVDVGFLFGLDLGLVAEVTALLIIFSVRDHVRTAAAITWQKAVVAFRPLLRFARRAHRTRRSRPGRLLPPPEEDGAGLVFA
jgi:hypothetical protein